VSGLNARKTFYFQPEGKAYQLIVEAAVDVGAISRPIVLSIDRCSVRAHINGGQHALSRGLIFRDGSVDRLHADDPRPNPATQGRFASRA
jgi:hypothetical protein